MLAPERYLSTATARITLLWPGRVERLMALAGGVALAATFFDLLPDAMQ